MGLTLNSNTTGSYIQTENGKIVPSGRRNYLINGNFDMWQYATSQTSSGYGSDDRWNNQNSGSTKTHSRITCTDTERALFNAQAFSRTVVSSVTGTGNFVAKQQYIEDVTKLAGKTVTLSFWAKANASKNISVEFTQRFGTGGAPSSTVSGISVQKFTLTTTWQKFTKTVTLPSIVGKTLGTDGVHTTITEVTFWFDAGSDLNSRTASLGQQSGTFDIAQVKIEDGSVATDGWHPYGGEFGGEIQACQRYYEVLGTGSFGTVDTVTTSRYYGTVFKVTKRTIPSMSLLSGTITTADQGSGFHNATSPTYLAGIVDTKGVYFGISGFIASTAYKPSCLSSNSIAASAEL